MAGSSGLSRSYPKRIIFAHITFLVTLLFVLQIKIVLSLSTSNIVGATRA
jgi:hypothetical protein